MLFSSIPFLYYFLPCTLLCYYLVPFRYKNFILLLFSLLFYSWGEPIYVLFMIISIIFGYVEGILIGQQQDRKKALWITIVACGLHLLYLIYFKYTNFLIDILQSFGFSFASINVALPLGISFYTFQLISYLIDVYRQKCTAQKKIVNFAAYVSLFPQLIAGPIVRYVDIEHQLKTRTHSFSLMADGIQRFVIGLGKKVVIANTLGELCQIFQVTADPSILYYWLYAIAVALQIYFDFSGYSDMAIGLGKLFGFQFYENFDHPFISASIQEFWRRWHISLGSWFKDYVYIPMGGNRVSKIRWIVNLLVVWSLTGLWHGAAWNFILWGLLFACFLMLEKTTFAHFLKEHRIIAHGYVIVVILVSFVLFDADSVHTAFDRISAMFGLHAIPLLSKECLYYIKSYGITFLIAIISSTPFFHKIYHLIQNNAMGSRLLLLTKPILIMLIFIIVSACLINDSYNPFLYFRF